MKKCIWNCKMYMLILLTASLTSFQSTAQHSSAEQIIENFVNSKALIGSELSVHVSELGSGKELINFDADKNRIPASTLKLLYTLASVDLLGQEFRYETKIYYSGSILPDGSLEGDVIIEASGDPTFASSRFDEKQSLDFVLKAISRQLEKKGISCIDGQVILLLPFGNTGVCGSWNWEDIANYYGSGANGFIFNENSYEIELESPPKKNQLCGIKSIKPTIPGLKIQSHVYSAEPDSGDEAYVYGSPFDYNRIIRGTIPSNQNSFTIKGAIPDPPLAFLKLLCDYLESYGISNDGGMYSSIYTSEKRSIGIHRSPELIKIVKMCNDYSINLYSEALGKSMLIQGGSKLTEEYPKEELWEALFKKYDIQSKSVKIVDACGLSSENLISARMMTNFITKMSKILGLETMLEILPRAGEDGNARNFMRGSPFQSKVWVKSGSVANVLNYSGIYSSGQSGKHYSFAIFSNHNVVSGAQIKREIEKLLQNLIELSSE